MIDIGQNDLADSFGKNLSYAEVTKRIPSVIAAIKSAVQVSLVPYIQRSYKGRLLRELQKSSSKYFVSSLCHFRDHMETEIFITWIVGFIWSRWEELLDTQYRAIGLSPSKAFARPEEGFGSIWMSFKLQRGCEVVQRRIAPSMQWDETSIKGCYYSLCRCIRHQVWSHCQLREIR